MKKKTWINYTQIILMISWLVISFIPFFMKAPGYDFIKVKGHAGNEYNEMVDKLAVAAKMRFM